MTLIKITLFLLILIAINPFTSFAKHRFSQSRHDLQGLTGEDLDSDQVRWDKFYKKHSDYVFGKEPASFLAKNLSLIQSLNPNARLVLDIAMGEGRNAIFMAKHKYKVEGVDISKVAIAKAKKLAIENEVQIVPIIADLSKYEIPKEKYDIILVFYFLERSLIPKIKQGLKPGGVVVFENYTIDYLKYDKAFNPQYLLKLGELPNLFKDFKIIKYQETSENKKAIASLIARK